MKPVNVGSSESVFCPRIVSLNWCMNYVSSPPSLQLLLSSLFTFQRAQEGGNHPFIFICIFLTPSDKWFTQQEDGCDFQYATIKSGARPPLRTPTSRASPLWDLTWVLLILPRGGKPLCCLSFTVRPDCFRWKPTEITTGAETAPAAYRHLQAHRLFKGHHHTELETQSGEEDVI